MEKKTTYRKKKLGSSLMDKKICLVSPAGASGNYIALVLIGKKIPAVLSYHDYGPYLDPEDRVDPQGYVDAKLFDHIHYWQPKKHSKLLQDKNNLVIQNVVTHKSEFIIINWFEKFWHNASAHHKKFGSEWMQKQSKLWNTYGKNAIVRAILEWVVNYKKQSFADVVRHDEIKHVFDFGSLYTDYKSSKTQFEQFGVNYPEHKYNTWRESQSVVFNSYAEIQQQDIKLLTKGYQKAIALSNLEPGLSAEVCWRKYKHKID